MNLTFSVTLNSGRYGFRLYDDLYGWYKTSNTTFLNVSKTGTYSIASAVQTSFNGGLLTITGSDIGDGAFITVNGLRGNVVSRTSANATFAIPALITPASQTAFNLAKNKTIPLGDKAKWGDTAGWEQAFDSDHSSVYLSNSNASCTVGVDIG